MGGWYLAIRSPKRKSASAPAWHSPLATQARLAFSSRHRPDWRMLGDAQYAQHPATLNQIVCDRIWTCASPDISDLSIAAQHTRLQGMRQWRRSWPKPHAPWLLCALALVRPLLIPLPTLLLPFPFSHSVIHSFFLAFMPGEGLNS